MMILLSQANQMTAKQNDKTLDKINIAIDKAFAVLTNPKNTKGVARKIKRMIVKRSRLGFGVDPTSLKQKRFKPLSASYKEQRKGNIKFVTIKGKVFSIRLRGKPRRARGAVTRKRKKKGGLAGLFGGLFGKKKSKTKIRRKRKSPTASHLSRETTPGKSNITATGRLLDSLQSSGQKAKAIVTIPDNRYSINIFGDRLKKPPTTAEVSRFLKRQGRNFFLLSSSQKKKLERDGANLLRQLASKFFRG